MVQSLARTFHTTSYFHAPVSYFDPQHGWTELARSERGAQQGAPSAGAGCAVTLDPKLKHVSGILGNRGAVVAIQDDISIIGEAEVTDTAMAFLTGDEGLKKVGCDVNPGKGITVVPHTATPSDRPSPTVVRSGGSGTPRRVSL